MNAYDIFGAGLLIHLSQCSVSVLAGQHIQLSDKQVGETDAVSGLQPETDE